MAERKSWLNNPNECDRKFNLHQVNGDKWVASMRSLSISDIENLAEALLDFNGIADLEIWLKENVV